MNIEHLKIIYKHLLDHNHRTRIQNQYNNNNEQRNLKHKDNINQAKIKDGINNQQLKVHNNKLVGRDKINHHHNLINLLNKNN